MHELVDARPQVAVHDPVAASALEQQVACADCVEVVQPVGRDQDRGAALAPSTNLLGKPRAQLGVETFPRLVQQDEIRLISRQEHAQPDQLAGAPR